MESQVKKPPNVGESNCKRWQNTRTIVSKNIRNCTQKDLQITFGINCNRFRNTALRQNFNLQTDWQKKKTQSNKQRSYIHQYKEVKEKLNPISFIYVWTTFEHQVQDMYDLKKFNFFYSTPRLEIQFRHQQGHQRAGALTGSIHIIKNTNIPANGVEQKSVNI